MVQGVSTRDYAGVVDLARDGFGVGKSSVSRDFVRAASAADVQALAERRFEDKQLPGRHDRRRGVRRPGERSWRWGSPRTALQADPGPRAGGHRERRCLRGPARGACRHAGWTRAGRPCWQCSTARRPCIAGGDARSGGDSSRRRPAVPGPTSVGTLKAHLAEKRRAGAGSSNWRAAYQGGLRGGQGVAGDGRQVALTAQSQSAAASLREGLEETLTSDPPGPLTRGVVRTLCSTNLDRVGPVGDLGESRLG